MNSQIRLYDDPQEKYRVLDATMPNQLPRIMDVLHDSMRTDFGIVESALALKQSHLMYEAMRALDRFASSLTVVNDHASPYHWMKLVKLDRHDARDLTAEDEQLIVTIEKILEQVRTAVHFLQEVECAEQSTQQFALSYAHYICEQALDIVIPKSYSEYDHPQAARWLNIMDRLQQRMVRAWQDSIQTTRWCNARLARRLKGCTVQVTAKTAGGETIEVGTFSLIPTRRHVFAANQGESLEFQFEIGLMEFTNTSPVRMIPRQDGSRTVTIHGKQKSDWHHIYTEIGSVKIKVVPRTSESYFVRLGR